MISGMLLLWYILTAGSLVFLIRGLYHNTPAMWVMKLAWVLIVLYTGPIGLFIYVLSCRQPMPGTHDQFINSHWKQSVGSLMQRCFYTPCSFHAARSHNVPPPYGTKTPSNECSRSHISDHCLSNSVGVDYVNVCYAETVMMY